MTMAQFYERPDRVALFLMEDRAALLAFVGVEPKGRLKVVAGAVA